MKKLINARKRKALTKQLNNTNQELSQAKYDLIEEYVSLARQEMNLAPLNTALEVLASINVNPALGHSAHTHVSLQSEVAKTFMQIGRKTNNRLALEKSKHAYRAAITLSSVIGDEALREDLRENYRIVLSILGDKAPNPSLFKVA